MQIIEGANLWEFNTPGSLGVVQNVRYVRCYWPRLDEPTALFADGSSGIEVQGPPTPRNVVFPEDTVALSIAVNDAPVKPGEAPRWRETDVLTKMDCYFNREFELDAELVPVAASKDVEVEPGIVASVDYFRLEGVERAQERLTHLTPEEARTHARDNWGKLSSVAEEFEALG